jgi:hypothetical protein
MALACTKEIRIRGIWMSTDVRKRCARLVGADKYGALLKQAMKTLMDT